MGSINKGPQISPDPMRGLFTIQEIYFLSSPEGLVMGLAIAYIAALLK
jgi:hypothetical protein